MTNKFICLFLICLYTSVFANDSNNIIPHHKLKLGNKDILLETTTTTVNVPCVRAESWEWGSDMECPSVIFAEFKVWYRQQEVFIPISALADLGNPNSITIRLSGKSKYEILISGGDAVSTYNVSLKLNKTTLIEKIIKHGEFPENRWEKITYKFNNL